MRLDAPEPGQSEREMHATVKTPQFENHEFGLIINGRSTPGASTLDVVNPATGKIFASCARADKSDLQAAIASAKNAFTSWSTTPIEKRRQALLEVADALALRVAEFARLLTQEQGKPLAHATAEIEGSVFILRAFAAMDLPPIVLQDTDTVRIVLQKLPLGVVAAITPWNYPMTLLIFKFAPALLAGNTLVAKPAATTPLTTLLFGELCSGILPAGVFNVIVDNNDLGDAFTSHPDVAKVAFTGSTATGKKVMASAAQSLKRLTLELGGNDAAIVLDDVNIKETAAKLFAGAMVNSGQVCMAIKRAYVPASIYDEMCSELARLADAAVVGDGMNAATEFGPLQNKAQFEKVKQFLEDGRKNGRIVGGGKPIQGDGYFISPTIVRDISEGSRLVCEEQFGPILPVLKYEDLDDAIARANNSPYGLGGTVWGKDLDRARRVAERITSGTVWINKHPCPPRLAHALLRQYPRQSLGG
jgi:acyl-CoA reductase-like NAD-dependent aldehyde dehydrogenase